MTGSDDLADPLAGVAGDPADVDLSRAGDGGGDHGGVQLVAALLDGLLCPPVGAGRGFEFAGHITSLTESGRPNKFGLVTPTLLCQTEVRVSRR